MSKARELADLGSVTTRLDEVGNTDGALSNRNLIINGAMQVAQRGTSFTTASSGTYSCDRWINEHDSSTFDLDFEQVSGSAPAGFNYSLKCTVQTTATLTTTGYIIPFEQRLERNIVDQIGLGTSDAKPFTLSFWIKSNRTGTYTVNPTLDSPTSVTGQSTTKQYTIDAVDTWEYKTILFPANTFASPNVGFNAKAMTFFWWVITGSNYSSGTLPTGWKAEVASERAVGCSNSTTVGDYWQITGVQLEVGDSASPFEHRSYGDELARCQRYYHQTTNYGISSSAVSLTEVFYHSYAKGASEWEHNTSTFPVTMRATPTVVTSDAAGTKSKISHFTSIGGGSADNKTPYTLYATRDGFKCSEYITGSIYGFSYEYSADAEL